MIKKSPIGLLLPLLFACTNEQISETFEPFFIEEAGRYALFGEQGYVEVFEVNGTGINYEFFREWKNDDGEFSSRWGPTNPEIKVIDNWFFYAETPDRIWLAFGEDLHLLRQEAERRGRWGVIESCSGGPAWSLVPEIPHPVLKRLPASVLELISEAQPDEGDNSE